MCVLLVGVPLSAVDEQKNLLITEIFSASTDDSKAEFIELYNPNDYPIDLTDWKVQYKSATGEQWQTKLTFDEFEAQPRGFVLLATEELNLEPEEFDFEFNSGLAASAGHIRLIQLVEVEDTDTGELSEEEKVHDVLGYGVAADSPETVPATEPAAGQSLKRIVDEDGLFIDTNDNSLDFEVSDDPTPTRTPSVEEAEPVEEPDPEEQPLPDEGTGNDQDYLSVEISELFIDPKSPQTDADDEFVELYNPSALEIDLDGYVIQTGSKLQYRFEITDIVLPAKSYIAFESRDSGLVLANSGGKAQVLAPDGSIVSELVAYEKAPIGESWSKIGTTYVFTNRVTPGQQNLSPHEDTASVASASSSSQTPKKRSYAKVVITELLPNPASPLLDKNDEFVELYNPNTFAVNVKDYKLKTGKSLATTQTLDDIILQPGQYVAIFSADSKMSLGNSGGQAQLLDPNGDSKSTAGEYSKAEDGLAWAFIGSKWQWTAKPTPAAKNVLQTKQDKIAQEQAANNQSSESGLTVSSSNPLAQPAAIPIESANLSVVAAAGVGTLFYGLYEFRRDISSTFHRARNYVSGRRKDS